MFKFIFVRPNKLVASIVIPGFPGAYTNKAMYGDLLAVRVNTNASDDAILHTWHWNGSRFDRHERNTDSTFVWDEIACKYRKPDNYLELLKEDKLKDLEKMYLRSDNSDIAYLGIKWQANSRSKLALSLKLAEISTKASLGVSETKLFWRDAKNIDHTWSCVSDFLQWLQGITNIISERNTVLHIKYRSKKEEIRKLGSAQDIKRYDVLEDWS